MKCMRVANINSKELRVRSLILIFPGIELNVKLKTTGIKKKKVQRRLGLTVT